MLSTASRLIVQVTVAVISDICPAVGQCIRVVWKAAQDATGNVFLSVDYESVVLPYKFCDTTQLKIYCLCDPRPA